MSLWIRLYTASRPACAVAEPSEGAGYARDASRGAPGPDGGPRAPATSPSRPSAFLACLWRCGTRRGAAVAGAVAAEGLGWLRGTSRPTAGRAAGSRQDVIIHTYTRSHSQPHPDSSSHSILATTSHCSHGCAPNSTAPSCLGCARSRRPLVMTGGHR